MATVKTSALVDGFKGKVNGDIYQFNAGGQINRTGKIVQRTAIYSPQFQRNSFGAIAQLWRTLTQIQRNAWITAGASLTAYTRFNVARSMSGYQYFSQCNGHIQLLSLPFIPDFVSTSAPSPPVGATFTSPLYDSLIISNPFPVISPNYLMIEVNPCCSAGKSYISGRWRLIFSKS